jgi:serine/threonine-protein phosphatase 2A regulatory subunit B'
VCNLKETSNNRVNERCKIVTVAYKSDNMSSATFVDRIDPFAKRSLKKKTKKSQGSSRYRNSADLELQPLPLLKGMATLKLLWNTTFDIYWR